MTIHLGNVDAGSTLYIPFNTYDSNGASVTITGLSVGDILIYKNGSTTQRSSTSGFVLLDTDGIDFDGLTGIHGFSIDLSDNADAGFYAAGNTYWVVVSSFTADTRTVSFVAAIFRIGPTAANLTQILGTALTETAGQIAAAFKKVFDVAAPVFTATSVNQGGDNYARLGAPAGASMSVDIASIKTDTGTTIPGRLPAALVGGRIDASVGAMAANVLTAAATAADFGTEIAAAAWDALLTGITVAGSIGKLLKDNIDATISSRSTYAGGDTAGTTLLLGRIPGTIQPQTGDSFARLGAPAGASVSADIGQVEGNVLTGLGYVDTEVAAIKAKTDNLPASPAAVGSAMTLTSGERNSVADAYLDRADAVEVGATPRQSLRLMLAALAGKLSGAATTTVTVRNAVADSKNRIVATVDANGNRSAVTTDGT